MVEKQSDVPPWTWPLPVLVAWLGGWCVVWSASALGLPAGWALLLGVAPSLWAQARTRPGWRRWVVVSGLPVVLALTAGFSSVSPWAWLGVAGLLMCLYPIQAWRDAPFFPTPADALCGLPSVIRLADRSPVLDAGSGMGHGVLALHRAYPSARIVGVERSLGLVCISYLRILWRKRHGGERLQLRWGDMWAQPWGGFALVYVFQRPESMLRAWQKAHSEMSEGSWLVSLEFEVPAVSCFASVKCPDGRRLWIYRLQGRGDSVLWPPGR